jgi:hypothetical protein
VIRLDGPHRDDRIGALGQGIRQQKLNLSRFISAGRQSRAVIPLHPETRTFQQGRKSIKLFNRGGQMGQPYPLELAQGIDGNFVSGHGHCFISRQNWSAVQTTKRWSTNSETIAQESQQITNRD